MRHGSSSFTSGERRTERGRSQQLLDFHCVQEVRSQALGNAFSVAKWVIVETVGSATHHLSTVASAHSVLFVVTSYVSDQQLRLTLSVLQGMNSTGLTIAHYHLRWTREMGKGCLCKKQTGGPDFGRAYRDQPPQQFSQFQ